MNKLAQEGLARGLVLQGFDRATDELRIELHLSPMPIDRLLALFDVRGDPEICDAYPLDAAKAHALAPLVRKPIDAERWGFFPAALRVGHARDAVSMTRMCSERGSGH